MRCIVLEIIYLFKENFGRVDLACSVGGGGLVIHCSLMDDVGNVTNIPRNL